MSNLGTPDRNMDAKDALARDGEATAEKAVLDDKQSLKKAGDSADKVATDVDNLVAGLDMELDDALQDKMFDPRQRDVGVEGFDDAVLGEGETGDPDAGVLEGSQNELLEDDEDRQDEPAEEDLA